MSYTIWLKDGLPVRQLVPANASPDEYRVVEVYDQEEMDENAGGTCCEDCASEHYQEGYDEAKREAEARIEELEEALREMHEEITNAEVDLTDAKAVLDTVSVAVPV